MPVVLLNDARQIGKITLTQAIAIKKGHRYLNLGVTLGSNTE
jgi:hypothetical protein